MTLCISNRDRKQQSSRLYQRARTSHRGSTTPTSPGLEDRRREWVILFREVKTNWPEDKVQEYARLLAAHHSVGDLNVPAWVYHTYRAMEK